MPEGNYQHLHNIYIDYAAECGVPAALWLLTAALLMPLLDFRRALATLSPGRSDRRFLLQAAIASIIGTMVAGIMEKNLGDTEVLTMFLAIMCLGLSRRATACSRNRLIYWGFTLNKSLLPNYAFRNTTASWTGDQV